MNPRSSSSTPRVERRYSPAFCAGAQSRSDVMWKMTDIDVVRPWRWSLGDHRRPLTVRTHDRLTLRLLDRDDLGRLAVGRCISSGTGREQGGGQHGPAECHEAGDAKAP